MLSSMRRLGNQKIHRIDLRLERARAGLATRIRGLPLRTRQLKFAARITRKKKTRSEKGGLREFERAAREGLEPAARCDIRDLNSEPIPILETGAL